jgi:DNA polymerase III subunit chi
MTNISFHFNVADTLNYVCRLVRKAWQQQKPVLVVGTQAWLEELDGALWTFSDVDFIPHSFVGDNEHGEVDDVSDEVVNVWLATAEQINTLAAGHAGFLIHLGDALPEGFERFERLIEIVPQEESAKVEARKRWGYYKQRGYPLAHHDAKN